MKALKTKAPMTFTCLSMAVLLAAAPGSAEDREAPFRPPAVPLVTHDPYLSIWSAADRLTDVWSSHWTGKRHALSSLVRIDGKAYRVMGPDPPAVPALPQISVDAFPTRTVYEFGCAEVRLTLTFTTPMLPDDLDILSRPLTYITWEARSSDGRPHAVSIYFDGSAEITVNSPDQQVTGSREEAGDLAVLRMGSKDQPILAKKGDDLRIDWGYLYTAAPKDASTRQVLCSGLEAREAFAAGRALPEKDDTALPRPASERWPASAWVSSRARAVAEARIGHPPAARTAPAPPSPREAGPPASGLSKTRRPSWTGTRGPCTT